MGTLVHRELTRAVGETDASGQTTRDETIHEYGLEVDGVFVRIGVVTAGQIADAKVRADVEKERGTGPKKAASGTRRRGGNGGSDAPDEETPASAARTAGGTG